MADGEAISQLPQSTPASGDFFPFERSGTTYRGDVGDISGSGGSGNEIVGQSVVSGTTTMAGGDGLVGDGYAYDAIHLHGGSATFNGGDVTSTGTPGGTYVYFYGGPTTIRGGDVTISGVHDEAVVKAGKLTLNGGNARIVTTGGADAYGTIGGDVELRAGTGEAIDGSGSLAAGGSIVLSGGKGGAGASGGQVVIEDGLGSGVGAPDGGILINGHGGIVLQSHDGTHVINIGVTGASLGFYGNSPIDQQTGVAVTAAAIHAALVNLGLITA